MLLVHAAGVVNVRVDFANVVKVAFEVDQFDRAESLVDLPMGHSLGQRVSTKTLRCEKR